MTANGWSEFSQKWGTPTTLVGVITTIIFVVSIQRDTIYNSEQLRNVIAAQQEMQSELVQASIVLERTTAIQNSLLARLERLYDRTEALSDKYNLQREIIIENRERINNHQTDKRP